MFITFSITGTSAQNCHITKNKIPFCWVSY